jgi:uncharacterized protein YqjF (DUF2071 family)
MVWWDLLFMHWPVRASELRDWIPPGLELDTFEGEAWLGVVPFRMSGVRPRCVPPLPGISAFLELNVRTYVKAGGKAGVWFFSLDAASRFGVRAARRFFHLPYFDARMSVEEEEGSLRYRSDRTHRGAPAAAFAARYRPTTDIACAGAGNIDHWLTERYCLYTANRQGEVCRGEIHHEPWPLQNAEAELETNTMAAPLDITLSASPLLHFARRLDVIAWTLERTAS